MTKKFTNSKTVKTGWYYDTKPTADSKGDVIPNVAEHTQILHFKDGSKKTILGIVRIDEGELLTLTTRSNREFLINKEDIKFTERFIES